MRLKYHNPGKSRDYFLLYNILDAILGRFVRYAYTIHWCAMCQPRARQHNNPAILSDPRLSCSLTYTCDPVRRIVTVERTVGKVMSTLQF